MASKRRPATLKSRSDFSKLKAKGRTVSPSVWLLANYCENKEMGLRVGWTIPTYVGTAVIRNRFKRWIREYLQSLPEEVLNDHCDVNLILRRRTANFYKELSHEKWDEVLGKTFKQIHTYI